MVFPVSVQAFWAHQNDEEEPPVGFPNIYYTGMPSLEAWISKATAPERQRHARSMLNSLHGLLNSVRTWSDDQCQDQKISYDAKSVDEEIGKLFNQVLRMVRCKLCYC